MDSKKKNVISELSSAIYELSQKVENLKSRLDILCKETGGCDTIKTINQHLVGKPANELKAQKEKTHDGININPLCEKE
jgi:uncharacterized protein YoxC|tara:strand:- start:213 stop:449 length:237 start_codon:yes stop_codon:yes gene_type:complete